jgi:glycosyltransferase involved in cell wall biosynthesis
MRILHVIQALGVGGAERVTLALVRGARRAGHDVAIVAAHGALAAEAGVAVHPLPLIQRRVRRIPGSVAAIERAVRVERPDVIHVHNPGVAIAAALATRRGRRMPSLVSVHGVPQGDDRAAARILRLAGLPVFACGPAIAEGLAAHGLRVAATIDNGIPEAPEPADRATVRRAWNVGPERSLVLSVGRLVPEKNHALAIRALVRVPNAVLAVVGDGPLEGDLRAEASASGVDDRVVFAGARTDAWQLMGAADVVVLASRGEGLPLTVLEALAIGTPVVATAVRGIVGLLEDDQTALLVPPDDPDLSAAVSRLLHDPELTQRLASNGRDLVARFDEATMIERYLDAYERLAARRV